MQVTLLLYLHIVTVSKYPGYVTTALLITAFFWEQLKLGLKDQIH